jgi:putative hydrolase of HD superfamily
MFPPGGDRVPAPYFLISKEISLDKDRLSRQLEFILEIDKLKSIYRRTDLLDTSRKENSAEHCWHLAVMALLLTEHSNQPVDIYKVLRMVLIHDIVEIDAGDVYVYDEERAEGKEEREAAAAQRIFGLLPPDQEQEFHQLWEEFEAAHTPEAQFAVSLDRLMPMLHNYHTHGKSWEEHGITSDRVTQRNCRISAGSEKLWDHARWLIEDAVEQGFLQPPPLAISEDAGQK